MLEQLEAITENSNSELAGKQGRSQEIVFQGVQNLSLQFLEFLREDLNSLRENYKLQNKIFHTSEIISRNFQNVSDLQKMIEIVQGKNKSEFKRQFEEANKQLNQIRIYGENLQEDKVSSTVDLIFLEKTQSSKL